jgi:hypothetical protein
LSSNDAVELAKIADFSDNIPVIDFGKVEE